ncbi:MAG: PucR family transcriptional regulator ligand-binding domain-containing protein [Clostridiales Family XIII bacterium]|jgi:DNA-binding PucR family transcriptional regulator|nr:PucR family transcriptional regulator ligand-binding domain-containing protein [Clostridiales Family XIII bacterium]
MSITVADCLTLPSLKDAVVAGGREGLKKIVASVSVLEYADVSMLGDDLFTGNEMILTALTLVKDDPKKQVEVMKCLFEKGVVALVVYYIGIFIPKLDKGLIRMADKLEMPLIVMPGETLNHRYGEVIDGVMESIVYDRIHEKTFVPSIIERVAQFPERQRSIDNILRIISDRCHYSIILTDDRMDIVSKAHWPSTLDLNAEDAMAIIARHSERFNEKTEIDIEAESAGTWRVFQTTFRKANMQRMYVFVIVDNSEQSRVAFDKNILLQISESIQLITSIRQYSDTLRSSDDLVNAILNDDPHLINQVTTRFGIDIAAIHNMWILMGRDSPESQSCNMAVTSHMLRMKNFLMDHYKTVLVGSYEDNIICLMSDSLLPGYEDEIAAELIKLEGGDEGNMLVRVSGLENRYDTKSAYDTAIDYKHALAAVYLKQSVFSMYELSFVRMCWGIVEKGGDAVSRHLKLLRPLTSEIHSATLLETLSFFLLDADGNVMDTADMMGLHQNTIKYRLKAIRQKLGRDITKLPASYELYMAVALYRLSR